jgi:hypothetical protein
LSEFEKLRDDLKKKQEELDAAKVICPTCKQAVSAKDGIATFTKCHHPICKSCLLASACRLNASAVMFEDHINVSFIPISCAVCNAAYKITPFSGHDLIQPPVLNGLQRSDINCKCPFCKEDVTFLKVRQFLAMCNCVIVHRSSEIQKRS